MSRRTGERRPVLDVPSPVVELADDRLHGGRLLLKRDDLIHPDLPGNKWRKLAGNLAAAAEQGAATLLTFGGAYSNHIAATAAAGWHFGFRTVGVIRGEDLEVFAVAEPTTGHPQPSRFHHQLKSAVIGLAVPPQVLPGTTAW